jgi:hypothetical protein
MTWEHYAAIPGGDGASLVVVDGRLPSVAIDSYRLPDALDALAPIVGEPVFLRLGAQAERSHEHYLRLFEFDAGDRGERLPLELADPSSLVPPELRAAFERWLAEQRGAPLPAARPPWAPGWRAQAEAWAGCELRPHRLWSLSAVLSGERDGRRVWLKAVFPLFHHEPAVTAALAREHSRALPEVLEIDEERGWLLMGELAGPEANPAAVLVCCVSCTTSGSAATTNCWGRRAATDTDVRGSRSRARRGARARRRDSRARGRVP